MNDTEVNKTIDQMVRFIRQEAEEKAAEIAVSAEEEFNISKLQLLEGEKARVRREYERREGAVEVKKKVELSKQLNESRLRVLRAREEAVQGLLRETAAALAALPGRDPAAYRGLIEDLLVQALRKLGEPSARVRCREVDAPVVRAVLADARPRLSAALGAGGAPAGSLELDTSAYLAPPPRNGGAGEEEFESCCGGVVVTSADGRIVCSNTLDDRLRIAYGQSLPRLRALLFAAAA